MTKHIGNTSPYTRMRDNDLRTAFKRVIAEQPFIDLMEALKITVKQTARRFYVSEERAYNRIRILIRRCDMPRQLNARDRMFADILSRVKRLREEQPQLSLQSCVHRVIRQPAPEFYLTPESAKVILSLMRNKEYDNTH